jgi:hypothetical protein
MRGSVMETGSVILIIAMILRTESVHKTRTVGIVFLSLCIHFASDPRPDLQRVRNVRLLHVALMEK